MWLRGKVHAKHCETHGSIPSITEQYHPKVLYGCNLATAQPTNIYQVRGPRQDFLNTHKGSTMQAGPPRECPVVPLQASRNAPCFSTMGGLTNPFCTGMLPSSSPFRKTWWESFETQQAPESQIH